MADLFAAAANVGLPGMLCLVIVIALIVYALFHKTGDSGKKSEKKKKDDSSNTSGGTT